MNLSLVIATCLTYLAAMFSVAWISGRHSDNAGYFSGNRRSRWWVVAFSMICSVMSGVTFVSVPGMVGASGFGYIQMCLGFICGYGVIAFVLVPLYFRLGATTIYEYLAGRFGVGSYSTGAWFFFISKMLGASVRLFLLCSVLQLLVFSPLGLPLWVNVLVCMLVVLFHTYVGGVKSVIWTDVLQTCCMLSAVILSLVFVSRGLGLHGLRDMAVSIENSGMSRVFYFDDINHSQYFWKQFLGGVVAVVAITGMDQDMMQRTLTCRNYKDSQKNLMVSVFLQVAVIFLFLCLGVLMYLYASDAGIQAQGDRLFPIVATAPGMPAVVGVMFIIGLISCGYGAGGAALTALTTSFTLDILKGRQLDEGRLTRTRKAVHLGMAACMAAVIYTFGLLNSGSAINAVYTLASYTYGPILGMFAFGILTKRQIRDRFAPVVAVVSPLICLVLQLNSVRWFGGYKFSYELLLVNAALVFFGLWLLSVKASIEKKT